MNLLYRIWVFAEYVISIIWPKLSLIICLHAHLVTNQGSYVISEFMSIEIETTKCYRLLDSVMGYTICCFTINTCFLWLSAFVRNKLLFINCCGYTVRHRDRISILLPITFLCHGDTIAISWIYVSFQSLLHFCRNSNQTVVVIHFQRSVNTCWKNKRKNEKRYTLSNLTSEAITDDDNVSHTLLSSMFYEKGPGH